LPGGPALFLLAGPNGSGKSTLQSYLARRFRAIGDIEFVNADHIAKHLPGPDSPERAREAQKKADARRAELIAAGTSFCTETVFSHESRVELIREANNAGFTVYLIAVCVENPAIAEMRVQQRVARQGHDVPSDRIHQRYPRTLRNLAQAARIADCTLIFDNSRVNAIPRLVFAAGMGRLVHESSDVPAWAEPIVVAAKELLSSGSKAPDALTAFVETLTRK
jgi:predicted ABC-type ATPase